MQIVAGVREQVMMEPNTANTGYILKGLSFFFWVRAFVWLRDVCFCLPLAPGFWKSDKQRLSLNTRGPKLKKASKQRNKKQQSPIQVLFGNCEQKKVFKKSTFSPLLLVFSSLISHSACRLFRIIKNGEIVFKKLLNFLSFAWLSPLSLV